MLVNQNNENEWVTQAQTVHHLYQLFDYNKRKRQGNLMLHSESRAIEENNHKEKGKEKKKMRNQEETKKPSHFTCQIHETIVIQSIPSREAPSPSFIVHALVNAAQPLHMTQASGFSMLPIKFACQSGLHGHSVAH